MNIDAGFLYGLSIGLGFGLILGVYMIRLFKKRLLVQALSPFRSAIKIQGREYYVLPWNTYWEFKK